MLTSFAYVIPYKQLASMAKPAYSDNGELLDGGFDMSTGGVCGYVSLTSCYLNLLSSNPMLGPAIVMSDCLNLNHCHKKMYDKAIRIL